MLNLLEGVDLTSMKHNGLDHLSNQLQAQNLAWADRNQSVIPKTHPLDPEIPQTQISKPEHILFSHPSTP